MRLTLTLFDPTALMGGPTVRRQFAQGGGTIGRAADNDWVLADPRGHLSDNHCRIEWCDDGYRLVDTSATGVYLNESPRALGFGNSQPLSAGDRIALGDYLIAVGLDDGDGAPPPAAVPASDRPAPLPEPLLETAAGSDLGHGPRARLEDRLPTSHGDASRQPSFGQDGAAPRSDSPLPTVPARRLNRVALGAAIVLLGIAAVGGGVILHAYGPGDRVAETTRPPVETARAILPSPPADPPVVTPPSPEPSRPVAATPAAPPPSVDRAALRGTLVQLFRGFACADLGAEIADDGTVVVTGFVSRGDELTRLHREVSAVPAVTRVDSRATVEPWPFCEVTKLLRVQTAGGPGAPEIATSHPDRIYREGDALVVTATPRGDADSFLYVDYFDTDGKVVHMLPTAFRSNNRVAANERIALGGEPGKGGRNERVYIISPPFGTGLVVALSSQRLLFSESRPEQEDAGAYLAALAGALVRDPVGAGSNARITSSQQSITLVAR